MRLAIILLGLLAHILLLPGAGLAFNATGVWESAIFGSTIITQIEQRGPVILGLATVTTLSGEVNAYHLVGTISGGEVRAWHASGHIFEGRALSNDEAQGILSFKGGRTLFLQGKRLKDRQIEVSFPQETWDMLLKNVPESKMKEDKAPFECAPVAQ